MSYIRIALGLPFIGVGIVVALFGALIAGKANLIEATADPYEIKRQPTIPNPTGLLSFAAGLRSRFSR